MLQLAKGISLAGVLAMAAIILYGLVAGDLAAEGAVIGRLPWGRVSLVDLYTGFVLLSMWIVYRENSALRSVIWIVLLMTLGNLTAALYVLLALQASRGDARKFFMGARA
jgi:hypothetical protein